MSDDRLYELLPVVYRHRDAEQGWPLRALLRVLAAQVDIVEEDIAQLYENWFIETCQSWVVPYIGDLIDYQVAHTAGDPGEVTTSQGQLRNSILIPRLDVANTIRYRRRKGTLALLEQLAADVAGWPARVVEYYSLLAQTQRVNQVQLGRGRLVDVRRSAPLDVIDGPFNTLAHTVDVRSAISAHDTGRANLLGLGVFVWRLKAYSVTHTPATCLEEIGPQFYTFSVLGNDTPLYTHSQPETDPAQIASALNLPIPIRRQAFEDHRGRYYGEGKSIQIWVGVRQRAEVIVQPVPIEQIVPADLTGWAYRPRRGQVAVDPVLGRIAFPPGHLPSGVWVSYYYGFSADIGGGEYNRPIREPAEVLTFSAEDFKDPASLASVLHAGTGTLTPYLLGRFSSNTKQLIAQYHDGDAVSEDLLNALIDELNQVLLDDQFYDESRFDQRTLSDEIKRLIASNPDGENLRRLNRLLLELAYPAVIAEYFRIYRVGGHAAPGVLESIEQALEDWRRMRPRNTIIEIIDSGVYSEQINIAIEHGQTLHIRAANRTRPVIYLLDRQKNRPDALTITSETGGCVTLDGLLITGRAVHIEGALDEVNIRHTTLVPGWALHHDCEPHRPAEPSLEIYRTNACVNITHSIIGSIQVYQDEVLADPVRLRISDSILDATSAEREALSAPNWPLAHALLTITRSTVFGQIQTHAIELAEDSIFDGLVTVARRQIGCMRFCYVPRGSRTPRRYNCQPDLVEQVVATKLAQNTIDTIEAGRLEESERLRVQPQFNSIRYSTPTYCQLAATCADEITRGASDESEMGVFHDLFQPQRAANLRARLDEYTPAGMEAGIIYAS
jgi:hypothetical protein